MKEPSTFRQQVNAIYKLLVVLLLLFVGTVITILYVINNPDFLSKDTVVESVDYVSVPLKDDYDKIENGIHLRTGLIEGEGLMETVQNCTNCHSAALVIQNRMNKERWIATIRWMQETQNLWDLGENEEIIVDYLVKNYPSKKKGRRERLSNIDWYELEN